MPGHERRGPHIRRGGGRQGLRDWSLRSDDGREFTELGIQLAEHGDVNVSLSAVVEAYDSGADDVLERFVREMHRLEGRLNFVGYSMLCDQWILDWGMGWNEYECRRLIDEYQEAGIVERHEVVNPNNPDWPTSAVRLIRTSETVRQALGFSDGPVLNAVLARS